MEVDFICDECGNENKEAEVLEEGVFNKPKDHFYAECQFCGHLQDVTFDLPEEKWPEEDSFENEEDED
jgi:uncharacterized Zn finger protein